ncbi:MAG: peptidoglycan DD-metalloendopeptidase family protein [Tissierellia bacterium]|nr:peptidoglycan DD-metalloendopeptidase family protein [Tissierellia bacterium]
MGKKENDKLCIMIIPHTAKVKKFSIPSWLPKVVSIAIGLIILFLSLFISNLHNSYESLKEKYNIKAAQVNALKAENDKKNFQIFNLKSENDKLREKSAEIDYKLMEIDKLQRELEKIAGIQSPSRGKLLTKTQGLQDTESTDELRILIDTLDLKKKELQDFIVDIEERFEYLETIPDLWPTHGRLTSKFGMRQNPLGRGRQFHYGIDIANSSGTNIVASAKGIVIFSGYKRGYGRTVILDHENGYKTLYAHNSKVLVSVGDRVEKGQLIAKMGSTGRSTGSHLHFEIHENDKPIDPLTILK